MIKAYQNDHFLQIAFVGPDLPISTNQLRQSAKVKTKNGIVFRMIDSPAHVKWKQSASIALNQGLSSKIIKPLPGLFSVDVYLYHYGRFSTSSDLTNRDKCVMDALTDAGIIKGDSTKSFVEAHFYYVEASHNGFMAPAVAFRLWPLVEHEWRQPSGIFGGTVILE